MLYSRRPSSYGMAASKHAHCTAIFLPHGRVGPKYLSSSVRLVILGRLGSSRPGGPLLRLLANPVRHQYAGGRRSSLWSCGLLAGSSYRSSGYPLHQAVSQALLLSAIIRRSGCFLVPGRNLHVRPAGVNLQAMIKLFRQFKSLSGKGKLP